MNEIISFKNNKTGEIVEFSRYELKEFIVNLFDGFSTKEEAMLWYFIQKDVKPAEAVRDVYKNN